MERAIAHDDDVPIVTPIVQQAEQAAAATDAHMSVGKMEMISRAAAKMTKDNTHKRASKRTRDSRACRHFSHEHPVHALVHARDARLAQRCKDTFGARFDVSLAHDCDRRSR